MPAGRPPIYETNEELSEAIEAYFKSLSIFDKKGQLTGTRTPTTAGLALALGYCSRQSLYDQKERGAEFSYLIKKAITHIEDFHERNMIDSHQATGSIFWLKNHKWSDRPESEEQNKEIIEKLDSVLDKVQGAI